MSKNSSQSAQRGMSRRNFLGLGAAAAGTAAVAGLAGCTPSSSEDAGSGSGSEDASDEEDWLGSEPEIAESEIVSSEDTELLIIGAGAAGMVAAASAVDAGLDFIICDKNSELTETREYVGAVNTMYTEAAGVEVDENKLLNEITRYASGKCKQEVIKVWINESAELIEWLDPLMTAAGKTCELDVHDDEETGGTDYYVPILQHIYLPPYTEPMRNDILLSHIQDAGYDVRFSTEMVKLVHDDGPVTGAIFQTEDGYIQINATNTLLCTGGYAGNPTMMRALQPDAVKCCTANSYALQDTGDGIKAGIWAGGVKDVDAAPMIFDRGAVAPGTDAGYSDDSSSATFPGTIYQTNIGSQPFMKVNRNGVRFANESTPYDFICFAAAKQPGGVWCQIFDGNAADDVLRFSTIGCSAATAMYVRDYGLSIEEQLESEIEAGYTQKADTIDELADLLGFEGDAKEAFLDQVDRYNELYEAQNDEDFGKEAYRLSAISEPPFYGTWFGGSLLTTIDGLQIDGDMRVLDENGDPIEGLYAAGDVSGCWFANNYPEYIVGCASGRTMTEARHVVRTLAGEL